MKSKKLFITAIILIAAIISMTVCCVVISTAKAPVITEKEFPFSITYQLNGQTETIDGVYAVSFTGNGAYADPTQRNYEGKVISQYEGADTSFILGEVEDGVIMIYTRFHPDYLMGEAYYDYFDNEEFKPILSYQDAEGYAYEDEETLLQHGAKLISWEYPEPIENSYTFSHIAHLSGGVVLPLVIIAAAALLAVIVFVKRDKTSDKTSLDKASIALNFAIGIVAVPIMTLVAVLSDIVGSSGDLSQQLIYLLPPVMVLGLAASVGLRRDGLSKASIAAQAVGLAALALIFVLMLQ
ncbi:MAG: hypothetical protein IKW01_02770 [Firmicutes bacterium]|nr:hypothetical protein [Bacillota bacterium]